MNYAEYQEEFEQAANDEKQRYDNLPVSTLLSDIRARRFGQYYQIWHSIAERATAGEAAHDLLRVLASNTDYLNRYHCASALISVAGLYADGWRPERLSAEAKYPVRENVKIVHDLLAKNQIA